MAETAELAVKLKLDDEMSPGLRKVDKSVRSVGTGFDKAGKHASAFGGTLKKAAVVGAGALAGGLALAIHSGLQDLATLETATTSVTGAIKTMGLKGQVTANQIAGWANEIESDIGAAFDDKDITAATATLIRFGHVVPANIRPAMVVMTDLAAKTGSVSSASSLLAKALADPAKAAGKLARVGVVLTKTQQAQIKALVKAGNVGRAQGVILQALAKSTKGAAAASQGPYARALAVLADASEDARKALAEGFLPVIERVAKKLSKVLADPKAIQSIRTFGKALADGFDKAVSLAEGVDWRALGDGLKSAAGWAQRLFDAFGALPPEAKGLILALGGLTKLTGGAPIKIAVDFAKDALGGVLGHFFDRGSSPANPLFVTGTGIGSGGSNIPGDDGKSPNTSKIGKVFDILAKVALVGFVAEAAQQLEPTITGLGTDLHKALQLPDIKLPIPDEWPWGPKNTPTILPDIFGGNGLLGGSAGGGGAVGAASNARPVGEHAGAAAAKTTAAVNSLHNAAVPAINRIKGTTDNAVTAGHQTTHSIQLLKDSLSAVGRTDTATTRAGLATVAGKQAASLVAFRAGERAQQTGNSLSRTANSRLEAIKNKRTKFTVNTHVAVNTSVSVSELKRQARYSSRVARTTGLSAS